MRRVMWLLLMVLGVGGSLAGAETKAGEDPPMPGGWSSVPTNDDRVQAAALAAVSAQSAASGEVLKLASIQSARRQVVAGLNYTLTLRVLRAEKEQTATVVVWAKLDGTHEVTSWSWK